MLRKAAKCFALFAGFGLFCWAQAETVTISDFQVGNSWTWSYSEKTDDEWGTPYLFETYSVKNRIADIVQIEMSSSTDLNSQGQAHHFFIVDLGDCQNVGSHIGRLNRMKIQFYTRTGSEAWQRVSKKHFALAFTEKFNCLESKMNRNEQSFQSPVFDDIDLFQWRSLKVHSWYSSVGQTAGVAVLRYTRNYKMELVKKETSN
ncbi:MAG: hypothetical protein HRT45_05520 [Bdellovibrionales bacterium]|nr:hypothetical protein [Bdellovibrionales bacterium]